MANIAAISDMQDTQNTDEQDLYLVDGSGYIFRAYYALPPLTRADGTPVGAVMGFCNMIQKLISTHGSENIAVVFDTARINFRNEIYADYKANRDDPPEDLIPQFPLIREATKAFGLPSLEQEGLEADDLIAAYAKLARAEGRNVTIISSDKDLMQLVGEGVRMMDPMKQKMIGPDEVFEKFGVPPEKVVDVQALAGDSIDNIPGVPGIGIKTAAQLITEYGDLETLLSRAEEIKQPKRREKLIENADMARLSLQLVTLNADCDVPVPLSDLNADTNTDALKSFLEAQGFKTLLARIQNGGSGQVSNTGKSATTNDNREGNTAPALTDRPIEENEYVLIDDLSTLQQWMHDAKVSCVLAIDTETTSLTPARAELVGISISIHTGRAAYIPVGHKTESTDLLAEKKDDIKQIPLSNVIEVMKPILEDKGILKIGQNIKYDWQIFAKHGITMHPCDDTMLLSYTLDGTSHSNGMDELSKLHLAHTPIKYEEVAGKGKSQVTFDYVPLDKALDYAAEDADITHRLHKVLKPRLAKDRMVAVYEDIERPLIPVIATMELNGIKVDPLMLQSLSNDFAKNLAKLEEDIHKEAGSPFNVGSPKQVGEILFDQMGLEGGKKTKTGQWSTDVDVLEKLSAQGNEIVSKILQWRQLSKLKSTYTDSLIEQINPETGRVHTSFHMSATSTGRLASSDPNLQNIPIRTEEGRQIRKAFIAEKGHLLLSVDYSQVELRLAAEMANVQALKKAFQNDIDIHALTAARVFGIEEDKVTPELRRQAKAVNFGIIYGISGWGLAKQLGCPPEEAQSFIQKYLTAFHEIQDYMEDTKEQARNQGYVTTLFGRKCFTPNINAKNGAWRAGAERAAINAPLQGTAADIMKKAMAKMPGALRQEGLSAKMLLQVHDELIFEVPEKELETTSQLVKEVMENVVITDVPLIAEAGSGQNWDEAH